MLALNDLVAFAEAHVISRVNLEKQITVAEDDEVSKLIMDLSNANNLCTLIVVVPSHDANLPDEDTRQMSNNLMFFVVKKYDSKAGNQKKLDNFNTCQLEVNALLNKILDLKGNGENNCLFSDVDLGSMPITPVSNYFNQNGYLLQLSTRTDF
ncbi:hypothetical protein [Winogradskyella sp.]|uniref:hypothetical protein n=1 Tax=Winogradskyella sp. TaxID=1883156 RepID=UPI003BA8447C